MPLHRLQYPSYTTVAMVPLSVLREIAPSRASLHAESHVEQQARRDPVGPGQESVWDYPRPPALVPSDELVRVFHAGHMLADTNRAWRVLETSHAPAYYIPPPTSTGRTCSRCPTARYVSSS